MSHEIKLGDYSKLVSEFMGMLEIHPKGGFIDKTHLTGNWKLIGEEYPKIDGNQSFGWCFC